MIPFCILVIENDDDREFMAALFTLLLRPQSAISNAHIVLNVELAEKQCPQNYVQRFQNLC